MSRRPLDDIEHARRRKLAREVATNGGNLAAFAARLGLTPPGALRWLRLYATDLHAALLANAGCGPTRHQALVRLLLLKSVEGFPDGRRRLARGLGVSPQALHAFQRKWAMDGLDAAIADLMPDDDQAEAA